MLVKPYSKLKMPNIMLSIFDIVLFGVYSVLSLFNIDMQGRKIMIFKESNFSEQTAWISVTFTVFIGWFYSHGMRQLEGTFATHAEQIVSLWAETIIVSIVFAVVAFTALAVIKKVTGNDEDISLVDERDEVIEAKATVWAYFNLSTCITIMLIHIFCQAVIVDYPFFPNVPAIDFLIHGLMFSGLLVEFVARGTQIYRYRQSL